MSTSLVEGGCVTVSFWCPSRGLGELLILKYCFTIIQSGDLCYVALLTVTPSRGHILIGVERSSSVVECRTRNRESPGSNPPLLPFRRLGIFRSLHRRPCSLSCINEYLAIDIGGNVSDLVLARNCCLARMLPEEAENGVGMNRSVREDKKCEAL